MPAYPVNQIQTLLESTIFKSGFTRFDKYAIKAISKDITKGYNPFGVRISPRYLKESIWEQLQSAVENGQETIGYNPNYVDTFCNYIGFNSFKVFRESHNEITKTLLALYSNNANDLSIMEGSKNSTQLNELNSLLEKNNIKSTNHKSNGGAVQSIIKRNPSLAMIVFSTQLTETDIENISSESKPAPLILQVPNSKKHTFTDNIQFFNSSNMYLPLVIYRKVSAGGNLKMIKAA